jgi:galactose oxidase
MSRACSSICAWLLSICRNIARQGSSCDLQLDQLLFDAVFHAGPSTAMHWFSTEGGGSGYTAGTRPGGNSANGNAVMFDAGKILTCGGSEAFAKEEYPATKEASIITIFKENAQVGIKELKGMNLARVYANGVVLPDGKVLITGGATNPKEFSDNYAHYQPGA